MSRLRVMLCSPRGDSGGIASWTEHILAYYASLNDSDVDMQWKNLTIKKNQVMGDTPFFRRVYIGVKRSITFQRYLSKELSKSHWDVVHFTSSASLALYGDLRTIKNIHRHSSKAVIHFRFGRIPDIYQGKGWERRAIDRVIKAVDCVIVIDKQSYDTLVSQGYKNIRLLPNPLSVKVHDMVRNSKIERKEREVLFAGHLLRGKGIHELIAACRQIDNIHLTMMGKGSDETIAKLKEEAGPDWEKWLSITGAQPLEKVIEAMLSCTVFVLPTYSEGFPNVIIESMACECPIVTTDVGAIPEMLDIERGDYCGICVKPREVDDLRNAILKILNNSEYAASCGKNAKKRVNELYAMPKVWEQMTNIWKTV